MIKMIDISSKPDVERIAVAQGTIYLKKKTVQAIKENKIKKGNVLDASQLVGINAAKRASELLPLCHFVPITNVDIEFDIYDDRITVRCSVKGIYKTGMEMDALMGLTIALLNIWDMVKYLEKDKHGQYPSTKITDIWVIEKVKGKR